MGVCCWGGGVNRMSHDFALQDAAVRAVEHARRGDRATRGLDLIIALLALIFFAPLMILIACAVRATSTGPILFRQTRIGRDGKEFACLKFRTMVIDADDALQRALSSCSRTREEWDRDQKLRCDPRTTRVGRILRKLSFDELPQLFNVLHGEMSIVGPRPIVHEEIARYGTFFRDYCSVKPGITGLWQISGRNNVAYGERVRLDALYVATRSVRLDLGIILKTIPAVVFARGSY